MVTGDGESVAMGWKFTCVCRAIPYTLVPPPPRAVAFRTEIGWSLDLFLGTTDQQRDGAALGHACHKWRSVSRHEAADGR